MLFYTQSSSHHDDRDFADTCQDNSSCYDDSPLIRDSYFDELPITAYDLSSESILGIAINEPDSWTPNIEKDVLKTMKEKEVSSLLSFLVYIFFFKSQSLFR